MEAPPKTRSMSPMKLIVPLFCMLAFSASREDRLEGIPAAQLGTRYELIGQLGAPLGDVVTVAGVLVEGIAPKGGPGGGPRLVVQKIQAKYTQESIVLDLRPLEMDYWNESVGLGLREGGELEYGKTYELVGFETGRFLGAPRQPAGTGIGDQDYGFHFSLRFETRIAKPIDPIEFSPQMFPETLAILQGKARTRRGHAVMEGSDWSVVVKRNEAWEEHVEGRMIETQGTYKLLQDRSSKNPGRFELAGSWRLKNLADQVGRKVSLRGQLVVREGKAALLYRGSLILVESLKDPSEDLWGDSLKPFLVEGNLGRGVPAQEVMGRDGVESGFIVSGATWQPLPALLSPDMPFVW